MLSVGELAEPVVTPSNMVFLTVTGVLLVEVETRSDQSVKQLLL